MRIILIQLIVLMACLGLAGPVLASDTDNAAYQLLDFDNNDPGLTSFISDAVSNLFNNLKKLGVTIKDGVIKAIKLVADEVKTRILRIKVVKDRDNVIGTAVFPPLANEAVIVNSLVEKDCKIFISFRSDTGNRTWHISEKIPGYGFKIKLSEVTPKPLEFDYWIVLIEGQEPTDSGYQQAPTPEPEPTADQPQAGEPEPEAETLPDDLSTEEPEPQDATSIESEPIESEPIEEEPVEEPEEPIVEETPIPVVEEPVVEEPVVEEPVVEEPQPETN